MGGGGGVGGGDALDISYCFLAALYPPVVMASMGFVIAQHII